MHAEPAAITVAHSSGDLAIHTIYLASRRFDGGDAGHVMPCGGCCQLIYDLTVYTGVPIAVFSLNTTTRTIRVVDSRDLLPHAFASQRLAAASEQRRGTPHLTGPLTD